MLALLRLVAIGAGLLMVLGARADIFSGAPSTLACSIEYFGVSFVMNETRGENYWLSSDSEDALLVVLQPNLRERNVRMTFVNALPAGPKDLFLAATKGLRLNQEQAHYVRSAIAERSTQIVAPFGSDDSVSYQDTIYGQQLQVNCSPK